MFRPSQVLLDKYADILIHFALGSGEGLKAGQVVQLVVPDVAKPFLFSLYKSVLSAGGHPLVRMLPSGIDRLFYEHANENQLQFFPQEYIRSRIKTIDHSVGIIAEHDLHELAEIDPKRIILSQESQKKAREWMNQKEYSGNFTWTLALYGTRAMAKEAGLSLQDYWQQIIDACFIDDTDPVSRWKQVAAEQERIKRVLNALPIEAIRLEAENTDL